MADEEKPAAVEEAEEYESDLDDAPLPALRRAAASDDEEEEEDDEGTPLRRRRAGSDADSDGQGAAEVYDEGAYDDGEEYEEYEEVYEEFKERGRGEREPAAEVVAAAGQEEGTARDGDAGEADEAAAGEEEEEKKGSEPFAVPTTGAFYMHDDRFQESGGRGRGRGRGRQRRLLNNRKLWNPKEEQAWVHDRFDEMNLHDFRGDNTKRKQRGRFTGRGREPGGRTRGISRGNFRGNRSQAFYQDGSKNHPYAYHDNTKNARRASYHDITKNAQRASNDNGKNRVPKLSHAHYDNVNNYDAIPKQSHTSYSDDKSQKNAPRVVRGRLTKRYQPRQKGNTEMSSVQNNESQNEETLSNVNLGQHKAQASNLRLEQVIPAKQTVASNLNSASPPFYPSTRPFQQEFQVSQLGSGQPSSTSRPLSSSIGNLLRGKPFVPSVGHVEVAAKGMNSPALNSSASPVNSPFAAATNQVTRGYVQPLHPIVQPNPVQSSVQSAPRMPAQMFGARFGGSNKMSSSVQPASTILSEDMEISSPGGSNKLNTRGQPGDQGEEYASFLYGGSHVLGATRAMDLTGEQGFRGTPALLPVMQFGSQRPGGSGVPSIGMAVPGFVSQQQLGLRNPEMTWLPMLTGASGPLGGPYGSPYIAVDGSYYNSGPSQQASSSVSPREPSASYATSPLKSQKMTEVVRDELGQRQNKPRRYSEMNFGQ